MACYRELSSPCRPSRCAPAAAARPPISPAARHPASPAGLAGRHLPAAQHSCVHQPLTRKSSFPNINMARPRGISAAAGLLDGLFGGPALELEDDDPEFSQWLAQRGLPAQKQLTQQDCGEAGRGLVAKCTIRKGEPLLQVPGALLITPDTALSESAIGAEMDGADLPAWSVLAVFLAEEQQRAQAKSSPESKWGDYIRRLPLSTGGILEWSDAEVQRLLAGTTAAKAVAAIRGAAAASWQEVSPLVESAEQSGKLPKGAITEASLKWAFGILLSRLIRLPALGNTEALIPWADFLNHSPSTASHLDWDESLQAAVLRPDCSYKPGEQVYASYGQRSSSELLLSYGFLPEPGTNPYDSVEIEIAMREDDPAAATKEEVLAQYGLQPSEVFPLRLDGTPAAIIPYQALLMEDEVLSKDDIGALAKSLFGSPDRQAVRVERAISALLKILKRMLSGLWP